VLAGSSFGVTFKLVPSDMRDSEPGRNKVRLNVRFATLHHLDFLNKSRPSVGGKDAV